MGRGDYDIYSCVNSIASSSSSGKYSCTCHNTTSSSTNECPVLRGSLRAGAQLGPDAQVCASTWNNMGDNYRLQRKCGQYACHLRARACKSRGYACQPAPLRPVMGPGSSCCCAYCRLTISYLHACMHCGCRYEEAEDCLLEAMRIKLQCPALGPNHPGTVTTFSNLGKLCVVASRWARLPFHPRHAVASPPNAMTSCVLRHSVHRWHRCCGPFCAWLYHVTALQVNPCAAR